MAAVCERERESMPVVGVAKDRQILRRLNAVLPKVQVDDVLRLCTNSFAYTNVAADV